MSGIHKISSIRETEALPIISHDGTVISSGKHQLRVLFEGSEDSPELWIAAKKTVSLFERFTHQKYTYFENGKKQEIWLNKASIKKRLDPQLAVALLKRKFFFFSNQPSPAVILKKIKTSFPNSQDLPSEKELEEMMFLAAERKAKGQYGRIGGKRDLDHPSKRSILVGENSSYLLLNKHRLGDPLLGQGGQKRIKYCIDLATGDILVVATAKKDPKTAYEESLMARFIHEQDPSIRVAAPLDLFSDKTNTFMILQKYDSTLLEAQDLSFQQKKQIANQLIHEACQMNALGVVHRDIKPENIFLKDQLPIIADFGYAQHAREIQSKTPFPQGTPGFIPPDAQTKEGVLSSDQWAVGITLLQLFSGDPTLAEQCEASPPLQMGEKEKAQEWIDHLVARSIQKGVLEGRIPPEEGDHLISCISSLLQVDGSDRHYPISF